MRLFFALIFLWVSAEAWAKDPQFSPAEQLVVDLLSPATGEAEKLQILKKLRPHFRDPQSISRLEKTIAEYKGSEFIGQGLAETLGQTREPLAKNPLDVLLRESFAKEEGGSSWSIAAAKGLLGMGQGEAERLAIEKDIVDVYLRSIQAIPAHDPLTVMRLSFFNDNFGKGFSPAARIRFYENWLQHRLEPDLVKVAGAELVGLGQSEVVLRAFRGHLRKHPKLRLALVNELEHPMMLDLSPHAPDFLREIQKSDPSRQIKSRAAQLVAEFDLRYQALVLKDPAALVAWTKKVKERMVAEDDALLKQVGPAEFQQIQDENKARSQRIMDKIFGKENSSPCETGFTAISSG